MKALLKSILPETVLNKMKASLKNDKQHRFQSIINASTNAGLNFGRSIDPNTNDYVNTEFFHNSYNLSSSITLFDGFRLQNNVKYQKFRREASEYKRMNATDDLAFAVTTTAGLL